MKNKLIIFTKGALKVCAALVGFAILVEVVLGIYNPYRFDETYDILIFATLVGLALLSVYSIIEILLYIANKE
mgnify:CR=1 FL=1